MKFFRKYHDEEIEEEITEQTAKEYLSRFYDVTEWNMGEMKEYMKKLPMYTPAAKVWIREEK